MIENMTEADRRRLDRLLRDLSREYGRLTDAGREELYRMHRDLGWALARTVDHFDHAGPREPG